MCKETNKEIILIHQGFDIAIIKRSEDGYQELVDVKTLNVNKRIRPKKWKL